MCSDPCEFAKQFVPVFNDKKETAVTDMAPEAENCSTGNVESNKYD